jgi:hypothetical protein
VAALDKTKLDLLNRAADHSDLSALDFRILYGVLSFYVNGEGHSWASQDTIAKRFRVHKNSAFNSLKRLVGLGFLELKRCGGKFGGSNHYGPPVSQPSVKLEAPSFTTQCDSVSQPSVNKPSYSNLLNEKEPIGSFPFTADQSVDPIANPNREAVSADRPKKKEAALQAEFENFWQAYPLKKGKAAARKAYAKARTTASADDILAGAQRYAQERANEDPHYTKWAQGWLNDQRWNDPVTPKAKPKLSARQSGTALGALFGIDDPYTELAKGKIQ